MGWTRRLGTFVGWTLCSRALGLIRDRLLGAAFGASLVLDAFFLAFALPNMLRNLFGEGALSAAFIPRYVRMRAAAGGESFAGRVLARLAIGLSLLSAVGMAAAGVVLVTPGLSDWALVAALALPQLPYAVFICVCAICAGILNSRGHFAVPAASPVLLNCCLIAAVLWWRDIWVLPYAVLATGLLQTALHLIALSRTGGVPPVSLRSDEDVRGLRAATVPSLLAAGIYQINALLDSVLAFAFIADEGAVVVLYFANRLLQFPMALVGHGLGTVIYPDMATAASQGYAASGALTRRAGGVLAALLLPAAVGLYLCAEPVVRVVFEAGDFDDTAVARTVAVTFWYALALLPLVAYRMLVRVFHAHLDHQTPMYLAITGVLVNLAANICFLSLTDLAEQGMALASLISGSLTMTLGAMVLARRGAGVVLIDGRWMRPLAWTAVMGLAVGAVLLLWPLLFGPVGDGLQAAPRLIAAVLVGMGIYGLGMGRQTLRLLRGDR